jgi:hypothetical protein
VFSYKLTDVSEVLIASIIRVVGLMRKALSTSETTVNSYENIPQKALIFILVFMRSRKDVKS